MALWKVPVFTQSSAKLCWEACARMMWKWRFKDLDGYAAKAGDYAKLDKGLIEDELDTFYKILGLRSLVGPKGKNLQFALSWSPVIITAGDRSQAHACVLAGFENGKYIEVNPCSVESVDFETDSTTCEAKTLKIKSADLEGGLGKYMWYW
jgi:hypothetical protein